MLFLLPCLHVVKAKNTKGKIYPPNPDSELTLLIRDMFNYYDSLRLDLQSGEVPEDIKTFLEVHEAASTDPKKSKSELYRAMAEVYLQAADRIVTADNKISAFNNMVDNCMNCHKQMCPGPMVKIKKLYLKN